MDPFSAQIFVTILALVGIVLLISALLSGVIERTGLPQVAVFLLLGAILGPAGLGVLHITLDSPMLRVIATLSLTLVLFTAAISVDLVEVRRYRTLTTLMIGPGTALNAVLIALLAWAMLGLSPAAAAILGAALASTDPVMLRGLLRERRIPNMVRQALTLESGFNDALLLPVVLVAMAFLDNQTQHNATAWARLGLELFVLGPGAGVVVAVVAIGVLDLVRRRAGIRRDYESLYSLGIAFTAYAVAQSVQGSGFLAAFAAGLTISALDVELCDCFVEYGETTSEMALLLTFVLLGSGPIWDGFLVLSGTVALFAVLALLLRVPVLLVGLSRVRLDRTSRLLIAWFGPRGLSSLLQVLLPVFAGISGSRRLFEICCVVVLLSVLVHGGTPPVLAQRRRRLQRTSGSIAGENREAPVAEQAPRPPAGQTTESLQPAPESPGADGKGADQATPNAGVAAPQSPTPQPRDKHHDGKPLVADHERITIAELRRLWELDAPVAIVDARTDRTLGRSELQARGAIRLLPDHDAREQATRLQLSHEAWLVVYCA